MRLIIQRVQHASVKIEDKIHSAIKKGLLVLLGIENNDTKDDIEWLVRKLINLRIFSDSEGAMNLSVQDVEGELLVVSQFTLFASTKKGNRPSFLRSAKPDIAIPIYETFLKELNKNGMEAQTGVFGADMKIELLNDGPITIAIDSKNRE